MCAEGKNEVNPSLRRTTAGPSLFATLSILILRSYQCDAFQLLPAWRIQNNRASASAPFRTSAGGPPGRAATTSSSSDETTTTDAASDGGGPFDKIFGDLFEPLQKMLSGLVATDAAASSSSSISNDYDEPISEAKIVLNRAAETKKEDPETVLDALEGLEKLMRRKAKAEPDTAARQVLESLDGDWRLVFTTGTRDTQKKLGAKINYFPIKAVQSFRVKEDPMRIQNGIYIGDFAIVKFFGDFEFNLKSRKLEFDFDQIAIAGFTINLGKGKAAEIGAASGLGSENNVDLVEKNKKPFFNWISADETIATARGGGGGLALWTRVVPEPLESEP